MWPEGHGIWQIDQFRFLCLRLRVGVDPRLLQATVAKNFQKIKTLGGLSDASWIDLAAVGGNDDVICRLIAVFAGQ